MDWAIYIISNELWPIVDTVIMDDSELMKRHLTNPSEETSAAMHCGACERPGLYIPV